jgi:uncharacterized surface protein with fasciclin (FAS1) repeats
MNVTKALKISISASTLCALAFAPVSFADTPNPDATNSCHNQQKGDLFKVAKEAGKFETLLMAVEAAGLKEELQAAKSLTLFAPTDEAFAKIAQADLQALLADKEALKSVLKYHLVGAKLNQRTIENIPAARTLNGELLNFREEGDAWMVQNAKIVATDIKFDNGIIHVVDSVLMADAAAPAPE